MQFGDQVLRLGAWHLDVEVRAQGGDEVERSVVDPPRGQAAGDQQAVAHEQDRFHEGHHLVATRQVSLELVGRPFGRGDHRQPQVPRIALVPREGDEVVGAWRGTHEAPRRVAHALERRLDGRRRQDEPTRAAPGEMMAEFRLCAQQEVGDLAVHQLGRGEPLRPRQPELSRHPPLPALLHRLHRQLHHQPFLPLEGVGNVDDVQDALAGGICAGLALLGVYAGGECWRQGPQLLDPRARVGGERGPRGRELGHGIGFHRLGACLLREPRRLTLGLASAFGFALLGLAQRLRFGVVGVVRGVGKRPGAIARHDRCPEVPAVSVFERVRTGAMHLQAIARDGAELDLIALAPLDRGAHHRRVGVLDVHQSLADVLVAARAQGWRECDRDFLRDRHRRDRGEPSNLARWPCIAVGETDFRARLARGAPSEGLRESSAPPLVAPDPKALALPLGRFVGRGTSLARSLRPAGSGRRLAACHPQPFPVHDDST